MLVDGCYLIKNGVPWQAVFGPVRGILSQKRRFAMAVAFGELDGGEFDWNALRWKKKT